MLVAAFATRGLCADVVRVLLAEHQLITGEVVLSELRKALGRRGHPPCPREPATGVGSAPFDAR